MDPRDPSNLGLRAPLLLLLLLLRLPASTLALPTSPILEARQATPTDDNSPPTSTGQGDSSDRNGVDSDSAHVFNYYFLLIAIIIAILLGCFVFAGRRRKQRTLRLINNRQEALRRDLEGWPAGRPGPNGVDNGGQPSRWAAGARNWRARNANEGVIRHDEGLDELGEAPPPYNPGDKPPSIAVGEPADHGGDGEVADAAGGLSVPLRTLARNSGEHNSPPGYHESISNNESEEGSAGIARPNAAVTPTSDRFGSARRLLGGTEGAAH